MSSIVTMGDFFREQFQPVRCYGLAHSSVEQYEITARLCAAWQNIPIEDYTLSQAIEWLRWLQEDRGLSNATVNKYRRYGLSLLRHANDLGITSHDWLSRVPKLPEGNEGGVAYLLEEVEALLVAGRRATGEYGGVPARAFWPALILTLYDCGSRISATLALRPIDVSLDRRTVRLRWQTQKQRKTQIKAISDQTTAALGAIHCPHRSLLFPWPYDRNTPQWAHLTRHFRRLIDAAGLPQPDKPFQKFRCTSGSMFEEFAGTGSQHLGHSSSRVFEEHYRDQRIVSGANALDKIPRPQFDGDTLRMAWDLD